MLCYKDRCFCSFYLDCFHGDVCERALTPQVQEDAEKWSKSFGVEGGLIDMFSEPPKCFKEIKKEKIDG